MTNVKVVYSMSIHKDDRRPIVKCASRETTPHHADQTAYTHGLHDGEAKLHTKKGKWVP